MFRERLQYLIDQKKINQSAVAKGIGVQDSRISDWLSGEVKKPRRTTIQKISGFFDCDIEWLASGTGDPFPEPKTKSPDNKIDLLHEQEDWTLNEMVEMTKGVLESDTVYRNALSSNIRAFHKAVSEESEMREMKERMISMDERMKRMERMLENRGATVPQKRDKAANS